MRVVVQRVSSAHVTIDGKVTGRIGMGLLVFVGIAPKDSLDDGEWLAGKLARLRIFPDEKGQMGRSVIDVKGGVLVISQFTLHASTTKGTRPSFNAAAPPEIALPLYQDFVTHLTKALGESVQTGEFGALMQVSLVNEGPVTLLIDSHERQ